MVITGATSGIGRAAAREFAGRGDRLVLAARSPATLAEVREECRATGAQVLIVPTDNTAPGAVDDLARVSVAEFGGIDVWVHTAAVAAYGRFDELPGVYDALVGPLMRLAGLSNQPVAPHDGILFTPNPAGEAVRGDWLPDLSRVVRSVGGATSTVGSAVLRRLR